MGFIFNSDCPCQNYNEYEFKLKCARMKLHSKYIACISVGIVIWLLATGQANTPEFASWVSFASTIASIILSVIAIIMSMTGENKNETMRDRLDETVKKLEVAANNIELANQNSINNIKKVDEKIDKLKDTISGLPHETAKQLYEMGVISNMGENESNNLSKGWLE